MKRIKVLHTIRQGSIGGGETYLYNLVTNLDKEKYEPVVLSFTNGEMVDKLRINGIKTHVIETEKPFSLHLYPKVNKLMKNENIDLLHIHGTRAATNSLIPSLMSNIPSIYTVHGWSFHTGNNPLVTRLRALAERFITKNVEKTVCGSEADLQTGRKYCGGGKYELIHNSINTEEFNPDSIESDFRTEHGFSNDDFIIAFIARITFQKDPKTFIRAIPEVLKYIPNAKFVMIGEGELKKDCVDLVNELGVEKNINFLPFSKNVKQVLKNIDVFVLPSLWEVIPLALLEAMAMKNICIGTNIPGTTEALIDGENGFLFETGDCNELAKKIVRGYQDKDQRELLANKARKTVVDKFDLKTLVRKNEELYSRIMEQVNV